MQYYLGMSTALVILHLCIHGAAQGTNGLTFNQVPVTFAIGQQGTVSYKSKTPMYPITIVLVQSYITETILSKNVTGGLFSWTAPATITVADNYQFLAYNNTPDGASAYSTVFSVEHATPNPFGSSIATHSTQPTISAFYTASSSFLATSLSSHTTSHSLTSTATLTPSRHGPLNTGAAVGIGFSAAVVSIAFAAVLAFVWYRRRRNRRRALELARDAVLKERSEPVEVSGEDTRRAQEKDGDAVVGELITRANTHELLEKSGPMFEI